MVEESKGASRLSTSRWPHLVRAAIVIGFLASVGFGAVAYSGCGGGNACQACQDDCRKNNIPLPDCNCKSSCPGT